jgi:ADP-L-glycero-D-manno-heptose 6-epimerase
MKCFNVFGPNEYYKGNMRSMVRKSYESILVIGKVYFFKKEKTEFKDREQRQDFRYVKDAFAMTIFLGEFPEKISEKCTYGIYSLDSMVAFT